MASLLTNDSSVVLSLFDYELNIYKVKYYIDRNYCFYQIFVISIVIAAISWFWTLIIFSFTIHV